MCFARTSEDAAVWRYALRRQRAKGRWPTSPFSILGIFGASAVNTRQGKVYSLDISKQTVNAGVVVVRPSKLNASITSL
jgi:hypothetical protein